MDQQIRNALSAQLLAWGDDEFILGHRDSEWCGHAPILESDIAFANIALDELVEFPNGDWAFSMLRQYLFDQMETIRLALLQDSRYPVLAEAAVKLGKEEIYHHRHTRAWVERLSGGTDESHQRIQAALETLWPAALQLFSPLASEARLADAEMIPPAQALKSAWLEETGTFSKSCGLAIPAGPQIVPERRIHTADFVPLITELQSVNHLDPEAEW
jgi:ring-1,2-phenylacetyl-CoA epoxidase subunit PaaC